MDRLAALFLTLVIGSCVCDGHVSNVVDLTPENFQFTLDHAPIFLVKYYAPWCGHCQNMAEDYESAATTLKEHNIQIGDVDCIAHEELAEAAGIQGFPTIKFYRNGRFWKEYMGGREATDFVDFMLAEAALGEDDIGEPEEEGAAYEDFGDHHGDDEEQPAAEDWAENEYQEPKGFLNLDRYTFDKVVGVGKFNVFVKFDVMFPDPAIETEFAHLCERVGNVHGDAANELIMAAVHIADYDKFENEELRARYGFETEGFPRYVLWKKDAEDSDLEHGHMFEDEVITADSLSGFLMNQLGIYIGLPGCVKELDRLAAGFCSQSHEERTELIHLAERVEQELSETEDENSVLFTCAKFYVEVMHAVQDEEDGYQFVSTEKEKIRDMMHEGGMDMQEHEREILSYKVNILTVFEEQVDEADF